MKSSEFAKLRPGGKLKIVLLFAAGLVIIFPFYICIVYSLKSPQEIAMSPLALPTVLRFQNYVEAIRISNFFRAFRNTIAAAGGSVALLIFACSTAGYIISRNKKPFYNIVYYIFLASIFLPFQTIMFPLYRMMRETGLLNNLLGLVLCFSGISAGLFIFYYVGFVRTVPKELEESARIDGCSKYRTFRQVVFPLLKPINMTIAILGTLNAWNDFAISLIMVQKNEVRTLSLTLYNFVGEHFSVMNLAFAKLTLSIIPVVAVYVIFQNNIAAGITSGAVKG